MAGSRPDYLITGASGQLGRALLAAAGARHRAAIGAGHADLAVEHKEAVRQWVLRHRPKAVIHAGAWTDVDGCEKDPPRAQRINAEGTGHVALACAEAACRLVYVSTDFVFDGAQATPYAPDDPPRPISHYGTSKLCGELAVLAARRPGCFVVRTSWVFGPGGKNFPRAIVQRARSGGELKVVDDQRGRPTLTVDLAEALLDLADSDAPPGIYHAANAGECTWHEFAQAVLAAVGLGSVPVGRLASADLGRPARRPAYSVLDCSKLAAVRGRELPDWRDALRRFLALDPL
jgi:dTDP-4-dehydrorhamnose reductase